MLRGRGARGRPGELVEVIDKDADEMAPSVRWTLATIVGTHATESDDSRALFTASHVTVYLLLRT